MCSDLTKEKLATPVGLEDLKRAIEVYDGIVNDYWASQAGGVGYAMSKQHASAEAWRAAFEWLHTHMGRPDEGPAKDAEYFAEYEQGMALIRSKLT